VGPGWSTAPSTCTPMHSDCRRSRHDHHRHTPGRVPPGDPRWTARPPCGWLPRSTQRFLDLIRTLDDTDWAAPTDCPAWDVRAMATHNLGMAVMASSFREMVRQKHEGHQARRAVFHRCADRTAGRGALNHDAGPDRGRPTPGSSRWAARGRRRRSVRDGPRTDASDGDPSTAWLLTATGFAAAGVALVQTPTPRSDTSPSGARTGPLAR